MQLYMSTSCQQGSRVIRTFSDVEKLLFSFSDLAVIAAKQKIKRSFPTSEKLLFSFSDLVVIAAKQKIKRSFSTSERAWISSLVNKFY